MLLVGVTSALNSKILTYNSFPANMAYIKDIKRPFQLSSKPQDYPNQYIIEPGKAFLLSNLIINDYDTIKLTNENVSSMSKTFRIDLFNISSYSKTYNASNTSYYPYEKGYYSGIQHLTNDNKWNYIFRESINNDNFVDSFDLTQLHYLKTSNGPQQLYPYITQNNIFSTNGTDGLNINDYVWRLQAIISYYDNVGWFRTSEIRYRAENGEIIYGNQYQDLGDRVSNNYFPNEFNKICLDINIYKSNSVILSRIIPPTYDDNASKAKRMLLLLKANKKIFDIDYLQKIIDRLKTIDDNPWVITNNKNDEYNPIVSNSKYNLEDNSLILPKNVIKYVNSQINESSFDTIKGTYVYFDDILKIKSSYYKTLTFNENFFGIMIFKKMSGDIELKKALTDGYDITDLCTALSPLVTDRSNNSNLYRNKINQKIGIPSNSDNLYRTLCDGDYAIPIYEVFPSNLTSYAIFSKSLFSLMMNGNIKNNLDAAVNDLGYDSYNVIRNIFLQRDIYLNLGFLDSDKKYCVTYTTQKMDGNGNVKNIADFSMTDSFVPINNKREIKIFANINGNKLLPTSMTTNPVTFNIGNSSFYVSFLPRRYMIFSLEEYNEGTSDYNWTYTCKNNILTCTRSDQNATVNISLLSNSDISSHDIRKVFENIANEVKGTTPPEGQSELDVFITRLLEWSRNNGGIFTMPLENSFLLIPTNLNDCYTISSDTYELNAVGKNLLNSMQNSYYANTGESSGTELIDSSEYVKYEIDRNRSYEGLSINKNTSNIRMNTVDDLDMLAADDLYKGTTLSQDKLVNDHFIVQSLRSVIGLPFQFMPHVDPRIYADYSEVAGKGGGYGYHFIDKIIYDLPIAIIKPGQPKAQNSDLLASVTGSLDMLNPERVIELETAANKRVAALTESGINTILGTITGAVKSILNRDIINFEDSLMTIFLYLQTRYERLYTWAGDSAHYIQYVNTLCHLFITFLGIGDMDYIDGYGNTRKYRNYDDSWIVLNQSEDRSLFSVDGESREGFANSEDSEVYTINSTFGEDPAVYIFYNAETRVADSFSNSMQESMVSGLNSVSDQSKQIHFLSGIGGQGVSNIFNLASNAVHSLAGSLGDALGSGVLGSLFQNISEGVDVIIAGNIFDVPQMWSDSSHSTDVSISFKLASPSGDLESIFLYILRPLARVLAFSLPRQYTTNSYTSPFIIQAFAKGMFNVQLGVVESLSISRGGDGTKSYTITNLPTELNVQLTIKDMYEKIALSNEYRHDGSIFNLFPDLSGGNTFFGFGLGGLASKLTTGSLDTFTKMGSAVKTIAETTMSNMRAFGYLLNNIGLIDFCASYTGFNLNNPAGKLQAYLFRNMIANRYKDIVDVNFDNGNLDIAFPSWERRKADILDNVFLSKSRLTKG